jgi:hypothetical protein
MPTYKSNKINRYKDSEEGIRSSIPFTLPGDLFVKGPVPLYWLRRAAQLSKPALVLGIELWHRKGVTRKWENTISQSHLSRLYNWHRTTFYRALKALEAASLIVVHRERGKNPIVRLQRPTEEPDHE